jgi:uncharacterized protein (DUF1697 family)
MTKFAALLRGIAPMNPNMRNEKLRRVCESLGLKQVQTVISSGNVVFESDWKDISELEATLEGAWSRELGFESSTMIRSHRELQDLTELNPFGGLEHGRESYLLATFSKDPLVVDFELPYQPPEEEFSIVGATDRELFTVSDTIRASTPGVMAWLESRFGKEITSRTWLTVHRILRRMAQ